MTRAVWFVVVHILSSTGTFWVWQTPYLINVHNLFLTPTRMISRMSLLWRLAMARPMQYHREIPLTETRKYACRSEWSLRLLRLTVSPWKQRWFPFSTVMTQVLKRPNYWTMSWSSTLGRAVRLPRPVSQPSQKKRCQRCLSRIGPNFGRWERTTSLFHDHSNIGRKANPVVRWRLQTPNCTVLTWPMGTWWPVAAAPRTLRQDIRSTPWQLITACQRNRPWCWIPFREFAATRSWPGWEGDPQLAFTPKVPSFLLRPSLAMVFLVQDARAARPWLMTLSRSPTILLLITILSITPQAQLVPATAKTMLPRWVSIRDW